MWIDSNFRERRITWDKGDKADVIFSMLKILRPTRSSEKEKKIAIDEGTTTDSIQEND